MPYQILPPLLPDEFECLKASIAERGVEVPIIVDQDDQKIDGFHRWRACDELGVFCPKEVRHFETEAEKFELVLRLNCRRRQLNRQQKRALIAAYLVSDPEIADNHLANLIGGISQNTVTDVRAELETTFQIEKLERHRGRDGKDRPTKYKRVIANTAKEADAALSAISNLPQNCAGKIIDCNTAKRRSTRLLTKQGRHERIEQIIATSLPNDITIQHCDLRDLEVPSESVNLILTDVMWNEAAEEDWRAPSVRLFVDKALKDYHLWASGKCEAHWQDLVVSNLQQSLIELQHDVRDLSRDEQIQAERRIALNIFRSFGTVPLRVAEWEIRTGKKQATFYRRIKELRMDGRLPD